MCGQGALINSLLKEDGDRLGNGMLINILHCDAWHLK